MVVFLVSAQERRIGSWWTWCAWRTASSLSIGTSFRTKPREPPRKAGFRCSETSSLTNDRNGLIAISRLSRLERWILAGRDALFGHRQEHGDGHINAGHRGEIDDLLFPEGVPRTGKGHVSDLMLRRKLHDEIVDGRLVGLHVRRALLRFELGHDFRREPRLDRERRVRVPLDLGPPQPPGDEDCHLVQP